MVSKANKHNYSNQIKYKNTQKEKRKKKQQIDESEQTKLDRVVIFEQPIKTNIVTTFFLSLFIGKK